MAQKITHWLFITLILSLGFGQLLRFEFSYGALYLHDLLTIAILLLNVKTLLNPKIWQLPGFVQIFLGLLIGWIVALTRYSVAELIIPALYLLRLTSYLALFLLVRANQIKFPRNTFIASGLTTLSIGALQYLLMPDMRVFQYLGWDDHLNRVVLPHFDPTYTGVMITLFLFLLNKKEQLLLWLSAFTLCLTYARSILLSFAAAQIVVLKNSFYLIAVVVFAIYVTFIIPHGFGEGTNLLRTYSIASRFGRDYSVLKNTSWSLLTGVGYNTLTINSGVSEKGYPNHAMGPNSSFIYILATSGIIGLWGWLVFLKYLYAHSSHKVTILFMVFASLFNNVLLYPFALLWMLLAESMVPSEA